MGLDILQKDLGYVFKDIAYLYLALTHPSASGETGKAHNQRLEFLGDAVLQLAVSERLYTLYPDQDEGVLSHKRSALVQEKALSALAHALHLGENMLFSHGEKKQGGRERDSNLADAAEAVLGAIYLDGGFDQAREVIFHLWPYLEVASNHDYKSELQELTQIGGGDAPLYRIVDATGPDHERVFTAQCLLHDQVVGQAQGRSKKEAQQLAAKQALEKVKNKAKT